MIDTKRCGKCGEGKPHTEFNKRTKARDGLHAWCRPCLKDYLKQWRQDNAETHAESKRVWERENRERERARKNDYYQRNREAILEKASANAERIAQYRKDNHEHIKGLINQWCKANPDRVRAYEARRRSAKLQRTIKLNDQQRRQMRRIYKLAHLMTQVTGQSWHVDHIVPLRGETMSGLHVPWNLQVIPAAENLRKSNKVDTEMAKPIFREIAEKNPEAAITAAALQERQTIVRFLREEAARVLWIEAQGLIEDGVDREQIDMAITLMDGLADEIEEATHHKVDRYE